MKKVLFFLCVCTITKFSQAQTASAGADTLVYLNQTRPDSAFLHSNLSVGTITSRKWSKTSGPGTQKIIDSTAESTWVTGLQTGWYTFKVTLNNGSVDSVKVWVRDWQKKNVTPCRSGGGKSFIIKPTTSGTDSGRRFHGWAIPYLNRDNYLSAHGYPNESVQGGDTLYFQGIGWDGADSCNGFEIGDFGGSPGCPVYLMAKDSPVVLKSAFFRIGTRDSNVVQYAVLDGTNLRGKGYPYGWSVNNNKRPLGITKYPNLSATWVSNLKVNGLYCYNVGTMQIKLNAWSYAYGKYDKFRNENVWINDFIIQENRGEALYLGHTGGNGGQDGNPYGPPPRAKGFKVTNGIIINSGFDAIQISGGRESNLIENNLVVNAGWGNEPSQQAGILLGGNSTGTVNANIVLRSTGNGIETFGYGDVTVSNNVVDSSNNGAGESSGIYQKSIPSEVDYEVNDLHQRSKNVNNIISRSSKRFIRSHNPSGAWTLRPGENTNNTFIHPAETNPLNLIDNQAGSTNTGNTIKDSFPIAFLGIALTDTGRVFTLKQDTVIKSFTNVQAAVDWLFNRKNWLTGNIPPIANAGTDKTITLPFTSSITLAGTGTDADGTIASYNWTKLSGGTGTITSATSATTSVTGIQKGIYKFQLTVTDNSGAIDRDTVQVNVNEERAIKVNIYGGVNPYINSEWNNWNVNNSLHIDTLKYSNNVNSSVSATLSQSTAISDNGSTYGGGMAPAEVLRYTSYGTNVQRYLTFDGLSATATYSIELYAGRNSLGNQYTIFTVNGKSATIFTDQNKTNIASFNNLVSNSQGQISIGIKDSGSYSYINGFLLKELSSGSSGVSTMKPSSGNIQEVVISEQVMSSSNSLIISPNPMNNTYLLQLNNDYRGLMKVQLIDMNGRIIKEHRLAKDNQLFAKSLPAYELSSGQYIIKVQIGQWIESLKIIKQ